MAISVAHDPDFRYLVGTFFGAWNLIECTVDFGIGKLLKTTHEQTHLLTAGMQMGRKITLLRSLAARGPDSKNKENILAALKVLQGEMKRDVIAHSYLAWDREKVTFIERVPNGKFTAIEHPFTLASFHAHVRTLTNNGGKLQAALEMEDADFESFAKAALKINKSE